MNIERDLGGLRHEAERITWRIDDSGVVGAGADDTGTVQIRLGDTGRVQRVEVARNWWRDVGPERLSAAILDAIGQASNDRLVAWSARVAERAEEEPPADYRPFTRSTDAGPRRDRLDDDDRAEDLTRMLTLLRRAISELDDYRHHARERTQPEGLGRGDGGRVSVSLTAGQVTGLEISRRWLHEQPTGQEVSDEVESACHDAYRQMSLQEAATLALPHALAEVRDLAADPAALLRRLGLAG